MKLKKDKSKKSEKIKESLEAVERIRSDRLMKIGRILLWVVILFLLVKGVIGILSPSSESRLQNIVTDYQQKAELRETNQIRAASFAESFAYEYYTFSGKMNSDYEKRVSSYLAKNLEYKAPVAGEVAATVKQATATQIRYLSDTQMDIDVHLVVDYTPLKEGASATQKNIYLRVPVTMNKQGGYAVTSLPSYVPQIRAANIDPVDSYDGEQVATKQVQSIKDTLNSFFTSYYEGSKTELSYYLSSGSNVTAGIEGTVQYKKIDYITAYQDPQSKEYLVDATITLSDEMQPMQQRLFLRLQAAKGRYYIKNISTRPL
ncbi:conjugal transfer protein [Sinanaerobacter sp. ZZT-01]|uniref:conjugal transfer protein n=1 Tax=Sinanaerobacter sp. ZZT-01 TaxID=3111540 RepID=UPI002D793E1D|nr:conjugal transfer protein [Sinanaerobacter sp. ZZT-01]WRR94190.1 conjugal transfer protein [Sinanaerobacter sp. ZZT-01]